MFNVSVQLEDPSHPVETPKLSSNVVAFGARETRTQPKRHKVQQCLRNPAAPTSSQDLADKRRSKTGGRTVGLRFYPLLASGADSSKTL